MRLAQLQKQTNKQTNKQTHKIGMKHETCYRIDKLITLSI